MGARGAKKVKASGNHWSDGIGFSDWSANGGSDMYRQGLAAGLTDLGGQLYRINGDGSRDLYGEKNGQTGFWVANNSGQDEGYHYETINGERVRVLNGEVTVGLKFVVQSGGSQDLLDVTDKFYGQLAYTEVFFSQAAANIDALAAEEGWSALTTRRAKLEFFKSQVGTGADFDLKRPNGGFSLDEIGARAIFDGQTYRYDDFGNINYGYAAKVFGLTLFEALAGAGYNQTFQTRTPDFSNPGGFFDHSRDTKMIKQGFYFRFP